MSDIQKFSHEKLAGQRLMVGFNGTALDANLRFCIGTLKVGGVILFARNLESPDQIKALCESLQQFARSCRQPPLFIAVDQEGGRWPDLRHPLPASPVIQV